MRLHVSPRWTVVLRAQSAGRAPATPPARATQAGQRARGAEARRRSHRCKRRPYRRGQFGCGKTRWASWVLGMGRRAGKQVEVEDEEEDELELEVELEVQIRGEPQRAL